MLSRRYKKTRNSVNIFGENTDTTKRNTESNLGGSGMVGLVVNTD